jgi:hypothetical protein
VLAGEESIQFVAQIQLDWREFIVWIFSIRMFGLEEGRHLLFWGRDHVGFGSLDIKI